MAEAPPNDQGNPPQPDLEVHRLAPEHRNISTKKHFRVCLKINATNFNHILAIHTLGISSILFG